MDGERNGACSSVGEWNQETKEGAHGHYTFTAKVEYSSLLVEHLTHGGDHQGHCKPYGKSKCVENKVHLRLLLLEELLPELFFKVWV